MDRSEKAIAIAGGTGFLGRAVVARLAAAGHRIVVFARGSSGREPLSSGVELRRHDLAAGIDPALLGDCRLLVNLIGIKRPTAALGFEVAHVELPRMLADAAEAAGLEAMIHVSVAGADSSAPGSGPYLDSKGRGERALRDRGGSLAVTIVRPGVVYGRGDDMLRNLADLIRAAPIVPLPRAGKAEIAPIDVEDVAEAILRCVETPEAWGRSYDLVGPQRLTLREVVGRVAAVPSVDRRCWVVSAPDWLQRPIAGVLERGSADPLITRSQLSLLREGVIGDPEPARRELGFEARALDSATIERALVGFEPRLPSVRLVPDPVAARELARLGGETRGSLIALFGFVAVVALFASPWLIEAIWLRMAVVDLALLALALAGLRLDWVALWRPTPATTAIGLGVGGVMWAGAFGVAAMLSTLAPELWSESTALYAWADLLPFASALGLLTLIIVGEEIIWRGALGVGLAARVGAWPAVAISAGAFTLAHASIGSPLLLLAATLAGAAWTALAIRTRSLWASCLAHMLWDVSLLWLTPLI